MSPLKQALYQQCINYVQQCMAAAEHGIKEAQQAATDDTKSSAGDKYETGREMMQQETNRNMAQLTEANKLKVALTQLPTTASKQAENGSIVITDNGNFYIAISAGTLLVDGESYFAISQASPIGMKMRGLKGGDSFTLNGKPYQIKYIL